jgi:DNA polymerase III beta subunit
LHLIAQAGALANGLSLVALAVHKRNMITGLSAVQITAAADKVCMAGTDMQVAITAEAVATIVGPGHVAVDADRLASLCAGFPTSAKVTIIADDTTATITCASSRSRLPVLPWADLPALLSIEGETGRIEISGADCLTLLEPLPAAANEAARYYLKGVLWQSVGDTLTAVSTDGHRLIRTTIAADKFSDGLDLVLPREAARILARLLKSSRSPAGIGMTAPASRVVVQRSKRLLAVTSAAFSLVARLIDHQFPDYHRVIPPSSSNCVLCDRAELLAAMSRMAAVATTDPLLALSWAAPGSLHLYLPRQRGDAEDAIDAETAGIGQVAIPLDQLAAMITEIAGVRIHLEASEGRPLKIHAGSAKLALVSQSIWNFGESEKLEAEKRPASARSGAMPTREVADQ